MLRVTRGLIGRQGTVVVALGTAQTLAWGSSYYLPAILAAPMARSLDVPPSWIYGAFSAGLVVSALLGPVAGRAIDLRGGRGVLALSSLVFAAGLTLLGLAQGFAMLAFAWLVMGVGMALGLYDAAFAALARLYGRTARNPITGITLIAGFASTVGWPVSALLEAEIGWRGACFVWAACHLLIGLPLNRLLIPKAGPLEDDVASDLRPAASASAPQGRRTIIILLAYIFAATWFVASAMSAHLPQLLQMAGATPAAAVAAGMLVGPAQVAGRIAEFGFLRRFHPLVSARLAAVAHPLGAAALMLFGPPAAVAFSALYGAGNGILTIAKGTLPLALFGPLGYGLRQGLIGAPSRFVQALAPFLFGLMLETYGVAASVALSSGLCLSALAALLWLRAEPTTGEGSASR